MARNRNLVWISTSAYGVTVAVAGTTQVDQVLIQEADWLVFGSDECIHIRSVGQIFLSAADGSPSLNAVSVALRVTLINENTGVALNPGDIRTGDGVEGQSLLWIRHGSAVQWHPNVGTTHASAWPPNTLIDVKGKRKLRRPFTVVATVQNAGAATVNAQYWLRTLVEIR